MHRLATILNLVPKEDNYLIDTLLEWKFGKLMTTYLKNYLNGDRSKFSNIEELFEVLQDPCCKNISSTPTSLEILYAQSCTGIISEFYTTIYGQGTNRSN